MLAKVHGLITAVVSAALVLAAAPHARAQALDAPFLALFPQLRQMPAPDWVRPGVRITYETSSATIAATPDDRGNAGGGFLQVDVVAVNDKEVALSVRPLNRPGLPGVIVPSTPASYVGPPGAGCDFYLNPDVFKQALDRHDEGFLAFRAPYECAGKKFDAVHMQRTAGSSQKTWIYDAKSGVLLHWGSTTENGTSRALASSELRSIRTLKLPWAGAPVSESFAQAQSMHYTGQHTSNLQPGFAPTGTLLMDERVVARGASWVQLKHHVEIGALTPNTPPVTQDSVILAGRAQLGGLYVPPEGLGALRAGQLLDRDPATGFDTRVAEVGPGSRGARVVTIIERGQDFSTAWTYDAETGWLVAQRTSADYLHMVFDLQLDARN